MLHIFLCRLRWKTIPIGCNILEFTIFRYKLFICILGHAKIVVICWPFFKINIFRNTTCISIRMSKDQDRCSVSSDLGPNCLQRLSSTLIFWSIWYVTHSFFIHLCISNFNWVFIISKECLFAYFPLFQLGIFVGVKTFHDLTVCFRRVHSRMEATFSFDFRDVYSRWKLRIQFLILVWHPYKAI